MTASYPELAPFFASNQQWAATTNADEPDFLPTLATSQTPSVFWVGCADSRVPETTVLGRRPGDVFVHRNIANQFHKQDNSAHAALTYSVLHVGVKHVVVVGHTACGGCNGAWDAPAPTGEEATDALGAFLAPLIAIRHSLPNESTVDDLVDENVRQSVRNIVDSEVMKAAWAAGRHVTVHGWKYDLATGLITDLGVSQGPRSKN